VQAVWVDVGVENPVDLAIDKVEIDPPVAAPVARVRIKVTVRSTGREHDNKLIVALDPEPDAARPADELAVQLGKGQSQLLVIERPARPAARRGGAGLPLVVKLATNDALPFNNMRYATLLVREPRKMLVIADEPKAAAVAARLEVKRSFKCEVLTPADAERLTDKELRANRVVCLFQTARPPAALVGPAGKIREGGRGLVLVPGGKEFAPAMEEYNKEATNRKLLPAAFQSLVEMPAGKPGVAWADFNGRHPVTAQFRNDVRNGAPDFADPATWPRPTPTGT